MATFLKKTVVKTADNNKFKEEDLIETQKDSIKELDERIKKNNDLIVKTTEEIEDVHSRLNYLNLENERLEGFLNREKEKENKNNELAEYKEFISNQLKENTKYNAKVAIAKYYQLKYTEFKYRNLIKNSHEAVSTPSVCVKYFYQDPTKTEENEDSNAEIKHYVHTFCISYETKFIDIFDRACDFWDIRNKEKFLLTDQNHNSLSLLNEGHVDLFFRDESEPHAILLLREKNLKMKELLSSQVDSIKLNDVNTSTQQKNNSHLKEMYNYIIRKKPGLQHYVENHERQSTKNSFFQKICYIFLNSALLVLVLFTLMNSAFIDDYSEIKTRFIEIYMDDQYEKINSFPQLNAYVEDKWYTFSDDGFPKSPTFFIIGKYRIQMMRIKSALCSNYNELPNNTVINNYIRENCIENEYNEQSRETGQIGNLSDPQPSCFFKTQEETKTSPIDGELNSYDGSGYVLDFEKNTTRAQLQEKLRLIYIDKNIKALFLQINYFELTKNYFVTITQLIEFAYERKYVSSTFVDVFLLPHEDISYFNDFLKGYDIAIIALNLFNFIFMTVFYMIDCSGEKKKCGLDFSYFCTNNFLVDLLILILNLVFFAIFNAGTGGKLTDFLSTQEYQNMLEYANNYYICLRIKAILCLLISIKILQSLIFSKNIFLFFLILKKSYKSIILVFGLIFMTFLAFAFISWIAFGIYLEEFNKFFRAFPSIFYVYMTADSLLRYFMFYTAQSSFLLLSFFVILIMMYLFNSLIQSAIFESYRVIQITDSFSAESTEMKLKIKGIFTSVTSKIKSIFKRSQKT